MNRWKQIFAVIVLVILVVSVYTSANSRKSEPIAIPYSRFLSDLKAGNISDVTLGGAVVFGVCKTKGGDFRFQTNAPDDPGLVDRLSKAGVQFSVKVERSKGLIEKIVEGLLPFAFLIFMWVFFVRRALPFGGMGKEKREDLKAKTTFSDVAGIEEAKDELKEIVSYLKNPTKYSSLGGKVPKGVLLSGPPGTGKTLLAKAVAGEAGVPFFSISGSDFVEMFVGVGAGRVRRLFRQGKKAAPAIVYIDEIDAVGKKRGPDFGGAGREHEQTLNQLLVELDGFGSREGLIVLASTNRAEVLDPALLRPGRIDRHIHVLPPTVQEREKILLVHTKGLTMSADIDLGKIARGTPGFTGADLANLANEAALMAAGSGFVAIDMACMETAKDKVLMGRERRSMIVSDEERRNTAIHEAGHALAACMLPGADPVYKVSIIPRGMAMGITQQMPDGDRHTYTRQKLMGTICVLMAGRAAEELVGGEPTSGAANDIERATLIARKMVCEWGMSERIGPLSFSSQAVDDVGAGFASESFSKSVDDEVVRIIHECLEVTRELLKTHRTVLERIIELLLEKEAIDGEVVRDLCRPAIEVAC